MSIKPDGNFRIFCRFALSLLSLFLLFGTAIPLLHSDAWWIRVFDFPRLQIVVLILLTLTTYAALHFWQRLRSWEFSLAAAVGLALIWQLISIAPYTMFYPTEMALSKDEKNHNRISLLIYNVLADNRNIEALRDLIRDTDPDLILLTEPNEWWLDQLDGLEKDYPHTVFQPQENTYGMVLYSRLELVNPEVRFLIEPDIPSFRAKVRLRSGNLVTLYGVHPRPPGLKRPEDEEGNEREDSDKRDAELMLVAKEIENLGNTPVIVSGDFNDVAWSRTTHLFQRVGGLLDPRVGRGLFNTFDARSPLLRYPLDHTFASRHFLLVELRRLPDIGSDHFPLFVSLDYDPDASVENEEPEEDAGDDQEAEKAINNGKPAD